MNHPASLGYPHVHGNPHIMNSNSYSCLICPLGGSKIITNSYPASKPRIEAPTTSGQNRRFRRAVVELTGDRFFPLEMGASIVMRDPQWLEGKKSWKIPI